MKSRHAKSYAREKAMKKIFSTLISKEEISELELNDPLAEKIYSGTIEHKEEIDTLIKKYLKKWSFNELNSVNLAILELSVYEVLYDETPKKIVISEALTIAQLYTDQKSKNFIHFVLDNIIKEIASDKE